MTTAPHTHPAFISTCKGNHPSDFDAMTAATALQYGPTVPTTDADDFSRFEELTLVTAP